jgi:predicted DNA-binding protein
MTMHTTTVRFDPETWLRLKTTASDLGIATADYIRAATIQRLERTAYEPRVVAVERRLKLVEQLVARIARHLRLSTGGPS